MENTLVMDDYKDEFFDSDEESRIDDLDVRYEDGSESTLIKTFLVNTCGCSLRDGKPCSSEFDFDVIANNRADMMSLTREEIELTMLTTIRMCINNSDEIKKGNIRTNSRCTFFFKSKRICKETFLVLHAIGKRRFNDLVHHFILTDSILPRQHGNKGKLPNHALKFEDVSNVKSFLTNYADENAVMLPGAYPGFKNLRTRLLESHITKKTVWTKYNEACHTTGRRHLSYEIFIKLWHKLVPFITIAKPRTDLCSTCQLNNTLILKTTNVENSKKLARLRDQEKHLYYSERERLVYKKQCKEAKDHLSQTNGAPNFTHISFDFAQQVHYPSPPDQPGGLFFLTPRKCGLFGICDDAKNKQMNYLIDEAVSIGKGPNVIVSFLHHYLENHIIGIPNVFMHADNCVGQNKNNYVLQYLLWRVMNGKNSNIMLKFMVAGHTKFSVDRCFGLIKKVTKRTFISSLADVAKCVYLSGEDSSTNDYELVGLEDGTLLVQYYDWKSFLTKYFKPLPNITMFHHFSMSKQNPPGTINFREFDDLEEKSFNALKNLNRHPNLDVLPEKITPKGLTYERKEYLYKEIREYCRPTTEDIVAPDPYLS